MTKGIDKKLIKSKIIVNLIKQIKTIIIRENKYHGTVANTVLAAILLIFKR